MTHAGESSVAGMATLETLQFDNTFIRELPGDELSQMDKVKANVPRQVEGAMYSLVEPTRVAKPSLIAFSREREAAGALGGGVCAP
jgi:serine/tyrosine/threonine adenylyltransferase